MAKKTSNEVRTIGRDPFARHDVIRQRVDDASGGCDWCGELSAKRKRYRYGISPDAGREHFMQGKFCSFSCCKSYHDME